MIWKTIHPVKQLRCHCYHKLLPRITSTTPASGMFSPKIRYEFYHKSENSPCKYCDNLIGQKLLAHFVQIYHRNVNRHNFLNKPHHTFSYFWTRNGFSLSYGLGICTKEYQKQTGHLYPTANAVTDFVDKNNFNKATIHLFNASMLRKTLMYHLLLVYISQYILKQTIIKTI